MTSKVLVTYATRTGSTPGVAEAIGQALARHGYAVDVRPMMDINDVSAYDAVVAGSAIQGGKWLPEAISFIETHRDTLRREPFAAFCVCMTMAMRKYLNDAVRAKVREFLAPVRAIVPTVSEGYFAGALDLSKMPDFRTRFGFRLSIWFGVWNEGDHRNWDAVAAWADELPHKLGLPIPDAREEVHAR